MITITKKEEIVLNQIKIFDTEYDEGIPTNVLKNEIGIYEHELNDILNILAEKEVISYDGHHVKLANFDVDINTVSSRKEVNLAELDMKEKQSFDLIKSIVDENNVISKFSLEGHLLYGDLKLSDFRMYHIVLSLENKGLLKIIHKPDGDYYKLIAEE